MSLETIAWGGHPSGADLQAYDVGALDDGAASAVEDHLSACTACCDYLAQLPADGFLTWLREVGGRLPVDPARGDDAAPTIASNAPHPAAFEPIPDAVALPGFDEVRELGRGSMGVVYAATHAVMRRRVAVKLIHPDHARHPDAVTRFRREARAAAQMSHPNLVAAFDAGELGDRPFLIMELIDGENLESRLRRLGRLPLAEACDAVCQAARGLHYAHAHGLVHRDVKPANLMRAADGTVKVLDFGLAALTEDRRRAGQTTAPNAVMGTPDYMAPEQAEDARAADGRADVYALGCTLYHLLTGEPPFPAESMLLTLLAHRTRERPSARALCPKLPAGLDGVLLKAMDRSPEDRFPTAGALAAALAPFAAADGPPRPRGIGRRSGLACGALLLTIAALAAATYLPNRDDPVGQEAALDYPPLEIRESRTFKGHKDYVSSLALLPDGRHFLSASGQWFEGRGDYTVRLWEVETGRLVDTLPGEPFGFYSVACPAGGKTIVAGDSSGAVWVWDRSTRQRLRKFQAHLGPILNLVPLPDGQHAATTGLVEADVAVWDLLRGAMVSRLRGHDGPIEGLAAAPDGRHLVSTSRDGTARVWDLAGGHEVARFTGHGASVRVAAVSPDGRTVLTAGLDGTLRPWDLTTARELGPPVPVAALVRGLAFSPDGRRAAVAGGDVMPPANDFTVRLLDVPSGVERARLVGHTGPVTQFAFTPDGRGILSASWDATPRLWRLPERLAPARGALKGPRTRNATEPAPLRFRPAPRPAPRARPAVRAYREAHGLETAAFARWADAAIADGFRPVCLAVRAGSDEPRFCSIAIDDGTRPPTVVRLDMEAPEPAQVYRRMKELGYRPIAASLYSDRSRQKRAQVYVKDGVHYDFHGTRLPDLRLDLLQIAAARRFLPVSLCAETRTGKGPSVSIVMAPDEETLWFARQGDDAAQVRQLAEQWRADEWRPTRLSAYDEGGTIHFLTVAVENREHWEWECRLDLTQSEYEEALKSNDRRGLMPASVTSYVREKQTLYAAIWEGDRLVKPPDAPCETP